YGQHGGAGISDGRARYCLQPDACIRPGRTVERAGPDLRTAAEPHLGPHAAEPGLADRPIHANGRRYAYRRQYADYYAEPRRRWPGRPVADSGGFWGDVPGRYRAMHEPRA